MKDYPEIRENSLGPVTWIQVPSFRQISSLSNTSQIILILPLQKYDRNTKKSRKKRFLKNLRTIRIRENLVTSYSYIFDRIVNNRSRT